MTIEPIKIGILGTARVVSTAILTPASSGLPVKIEAVASRDLSKAKAFSSKYHIPKSYSNYMDLLQDPTINAVYIPLPNHLHYQWTLLALEAGKHVLCEKPLAANEHEAQKMLEMAKKKKLVLMEAFHYRFHPYIQRIKEIITNGELGKIQQIKASQNLWLYRKNDIHFQYDLAGGVFLDTGCYPIDAIHYVMNCQLEVVEAKACLINEQVDDTMKAHLKFQNECLVDISCSLRARLCDLLYNSVL